MENFSKTTFKKLAKRAKLSQVEFERAEYCLVFGHSAEEACEYFGVSTRTIHSAIQKINPKRKHLTSEQFEQIVENFSFSKENKEKLRKILVDKQKIVNVSGSKNESANLSRAVNKILKLAEYKRFVTLTITIPESKVDEILRFEKKYLPKY